MKQGLVIGKFMPVHLGHIKLLDFALDNCDELIVLLSGKQSEPINPKIRYKWLKEIYSNNDKIKIEYMENNLPDDKKFTKDDTLAWCKYIESRFPDIDVFISSEKYGEYLANYMNIEHLIFDMNRVDTPISGTQIRNNPLKYINYVPDNVKNYFLKQNDKSKDK